MQRMKILTKCPTCYIDIRALDENIFIPDPNVITTANTMKPWGDFVLTKCGKEDYMDVDRDARTVAANDSLSDFITAETIEISIVVFSKFLYLNKNVHFSHLTCQNYAPQARCAFRRELYHRYREVFTQDSKSSYL